MSTKIKSKPRAPIPFVQTFQTQDLARTPTKLVCSTCRQQRTASELIVVNGQQTTTFVPPSLVCRSCLFRK